MFQIGHTFRIGSPSWNHSSQACLVSGFAFLGAHCCFTLDWWCFWHQNVFGVHTITMCAHLIVDLCCFFVVFSRSSLCLECNGLRMFTLSVCVVHLCCCCYVGPLFHLIWYGSLHWDFCYNVCAEPLGSTFPLKISHWSHYWQPRLPLFLVKILIIMCVQSRWEAHLPWKFSHWPRCWQPRLPLFHGRRILIYVFRNSWPSLLLMKEVFFRRAVRHWFRRRFVECKSSFNDSLS